MLITMNTMKKLGLTILILCVTLVAQAQIKVLGIGNSFSEDALEQNLSDIARAENVPMIIANMYIGGCSIDRHLENIANNNSLYRYTKFAVDGKKTVRNNVSLESIINEEQWDYISVQQVSGLSGVYESYAHLRDLISWIKKKVPGAKILFHQTWAYSYDSKHTDFPKYDSSQAIMFSSIMETLKRVVAENKIDGVIPSGPAIQFLREMTGNFNQTRDGYHLSLGMGRYTASCTWFSYLTGFDAEKLKYFPNGSDKRTNAITRMEALVCRRAAKKAVNKVYTK